MKIYSPFTMLPAESMESMKDFDARIDEMKVSDEALVHYVEQFFRYYRKMMAYFPRLAQHFPLYSQYPFDSTIIRLGDNGVIIAHRPSNSSEQHINVMRPADFDPPMDTINIFDIVQRLQTPFLGFSFTIRRYDEEEARNGAVIVAQGHTLEYFWNTTEHATFRNLCYELLRAEAVDFQPGVKVGNRLFDAVADIILMEPAGFRRIERWAFEFRNHSQERVSVRYLQDMAQTLERGEFDDVDNICILTSGDLTSLGSHITFDNPRIRVWDRPVLNHLIDRHLDKIGGFFREYSDAIGHLTKVVVQNRHDEFKGKLEQCPAGRQFFSQYERIGEEICDYLFSDSLRKIRHQAATYNRRQRRDVIYRNLRKTLFWQTVYDRWGADGVIVDFKNYKDPIGGDVLDDVVKYTNKAIGRFVIVLSRKGQDNSADDAQRRLYGEDKALVLVVSDDQLLEMVERKERGELPDDVLEDLYELFLSRY